MSINWAEKYRPKTLAEVIGNNAAIEELRNWATSWEKGIPKQRAVILAGDAGVGKTSSALALANDFRWGAIEMNASDARNAAAIKRIAGIGSTNETFTETGDFIPSRIGGRKLIILDEADNLFERIEGGKDENDDLSDAGGKRAIAETITNTKQPIILIVNDYYELTRGASGAEIKKKCLFIKFGNINKTQIKTALKKMCEKEKIAISFEVVDAIAERSKGDLRAVINDLQSICEGKKEVALSDLDVLSYRDVKLDMFKAMSIIFKTTDIKKAKEVMEEIDETPENIILWMDENIPIEYSDAADRMRGFRALSTADVFLGRVRKRQNYAFWSYASEMMSSGVAFAKQRKYGGFTRYQFPSWLRKMAGSKKERNVRDAVVEKIGEYCHTSQSSVKSDVLPFFRETFNYDQKFCTSMIAKLKLEEDEFEYLVAGSSSPKKVVYRIEDVVKVEDFEKRPKETGKSKNVETQKKLF